MSGDLADGGVDHKKMPFIHDGDILYKVLHNLQLGGNQAELDNGILKTFAAGGCQNVVFYRDDLAFRFDLKCLSGILQQHIADIAVENDCSYRKCSDQ